MGNNRFFLLETYYNIRFKLPDYVFRSTIRIIPIYLILSIFEIFGLFVLFPLIKIILEPTIIKNNKNLNSIYTFFNFNTNIGFVLFLFTITTLLFVFKNFFIYIISKKQTNSFYKLASRISMELFNKYLKKPYSFHVDNNSAVLLRNFTQIPFELINYCILPFISILNELFILILIIVSISFYDTLLFFSLVFFMTPFLIFYNKIYKKKLSELSSRIDFGSANTYKLGIQTMEAYREITVFNKISFFKPKFKKTIEDYSKTMSENYLINSFSPKLVETIAVFSIFAIFISGFLLNKELTLLAQFLILFAIATYRIIPSLNKIILSSNYIKSSSYIFQHINFSNQENPNEINKKLSTQIQFKKKLEIKNLTFGFENQKNDVFIDFNLTIQKGQIIGIIGTTGTGKSTLLNILLRLHIEKSGGIYVDDVKIEKSNLSAWYELVSYVPQNVTILDGTIIENIAFGIDENYIDHNLLNKVIKQSQLNDFINELPIGIKTHIGEKGVKISGGQRQRIGIARALYHGGKILIFDEATSSLDTETEEMLTEAIHNISNDEYTMIIVAHRIQTLKYCDVIYKLENGKIKQNDLS